MNFVSMKNNFLLLLAITSVFFTISSCGVSKMKESEMIVNLSNKYSTMDIVNVLNKNGYKVEKSSSNEIITAFRSTKVELASFKVEVIQGVNGWKMKGKIKYEAYRDREMDQSVYTEEYVYPNSDIFVIKYGWDMLTKIDNDLRINE